MRVRVRVRVGARGLVRLRVRRLAPLALGVGGRFSTGLEELGDDQHPGEDLRHVPDDVRLVRGRVRGRVRGKVKLGLGLGLGL